MTNLGTPDLNGAQTFARRSVVNVGRAELRKDFTLAIVPGAVGVSPTFAK
jgi:hypothetical protein